METAARAEPQDQVPAAVAPEAAVGTDRESKPPRLIDRTSVRRTALVAILVFAFALRVWGIDWDRNSHLQPDERFWSDVAANVERPEAWDWSVVLDPERSPLNPRVYKDTYVYGTLPLWASEAAAGVLMTDSMSWAVSLADGVGIDLVHDEPADAPVNQRLRFNTGFDVTLIGRLMSALVDTATVAAVYLLARELAGRTAGLLAALLQSLTVLHIQYSHFLGSEPWVAFFATIVVWGAVRLARGRGGIPTRLVTAASLGFAIGSKLNGVGAAVGPAVAALIVVWPDGRELFRSRIQPGVIGRVARGLEPWLVMVIVAVVAYRIAQPYDFQAGISLVFNERFESDIEYLTDINTGGNWPWVQPLVGAAPLLHPLKQVFFWGMGPGLALAAAFGGLRAARRFFLGERWWAVPVAVVLAYFVLVSLQFYAIIRYLQPAYPTMVALAATGLMATWHWASESEAASRRLANLARGAVVLAVGSTALWALSFSNGVYGEDNARLAASDWMLENLPSGSAISVQEWDDGLPWGPRPPGTEGVSFQPVTLRPFSFGGDTPDGIEALLVGLDEVDYVVETSNKFYDALPRTPARFPVVSRYYDHLFDESLGFELLAEFSNPPSLFGIEIDDSNAEEAFTLYDHPTVFIWEKTDRWNVDRARELLNPNRARVAINAVPRDAGQNGGMLTPEDYAIQQTGSSYADVHPSEPNSFVAMLSWFAVVQLASFAVAPALTRAAGRSAGTAWGLSKMVGLLAFALPVWLVVGFGAARFSATLSWLVLGVLLVVGIAAAGSLREQLVALWQNHRREILAAEAVFLSVFLAVVAMRVANPDLWHPWRGGEKPMELAYFTAVTGSTTLPPYDPWLAGGSLNYYYFGWWILAVPTRLLGLSPGVAFNLGVATFAALAAVTVFSTTSMLTSLASRRSGTSRPWIRAGALGTLLFLVIGNLDALRQVLVRIGVDGWIAGVGPFEDRFRLGALMLVGLALVVAAVLWMVTKSTPMAILIGPALAGFIGILLNPSGFGDVWSNLTEGIWFRDFDWWDPSRVNKASSGFEVTEFPAFTVLFADLHPHFMAMPIFGLGIAGAAALIETTRKSRRGLSWLLVAGLGIGSGVMRMSHTWDLPAFIVFSAGAIVIGWYLAPGPARWRVADAIGQLVLFAATHLFVTAPYRAHNQVADSGFHRAESSTNLDDWLVHWGLFLFVAAAYWIHRMMTQRDQLVQRALPLFGLALGTLVGFAGLHAVVGSVAAWAWLGLTAAVALLILEAGQRHRASASHVVVAAALALGFGILVGVELFTQNADIQRLNTVFKFWLQVWHLFAVAAAFAAVELWTALREASVAAQPSTQADDARGSIGRRSLRPELRRGFAVGFVALLVASLVYPVLAVRPRAANRVTTATGPSLQGHLWLEPGTTEFGIRDPQGTEHIIDPGADAALIEWLRDNVEGRPTIVEAVGGAEYQWWGRISINTGLPTVLGWRWHQEQQRTLFGYEVNERKADVAAFFTATNPREVTTFLRAYDVSYVIVGSLEAAIMAPQTFAVLEGHPALRPVFRDGDRVIYSVAKRALAQTDTALSAF